MALNLKELMGPNGLTYLLTKIQNMKTSLLLEISKKSDFSGNYDDLTNKPTIPTELPNPKSLTFTGNATGSYDGSESVTIEIPTPEVLTSATSTKLGGIKADEKTEIDTVPVKIGADSKLYVQNYPSSVSELQNDSNYQTGTQVLDAINTATNDMATKTYVNAQIANIDHLSREKVEKLPDISEANPNIIYMVPNLSEGNNIYDEYMFIDGAYEPMGTTAVELSGYVKETELGEIGNAEIDAIWNTVFGGDET